MEENIFFKEIDGITYTSDMRVITGCKKDIEGHIIIMARKTAANPDAYYLDLRVRLSVGCKRRSYFFFLYLPVFSYLRLWYSVH